MSYLSLYLNKVYVNPFNHPYVSVCLVLTSPSSPLSRKAVAMLFCTALIQACRSFSVSACIIQLLLGQRASHTGCLLNVHVGVCNWEKVGALLPHLKYNSPVLIRPIGTWTYLVGETTSKQNRRSMSSQCLTVHSLRSSTTTVGVSCGDSTAALVKTQNAQTSFKLLAFNIKNRFTDKLSAKIIQFYYANI